MAAEAAPVVAVAADVAAAAVEDETAAEVARAEAAAGGLSSH